MRKYQHIWSFLRNFYNPRRRSLQPPSLASKHSTCTHTHAVWRLEFLLTCTMGWSKPLARRATTAPRRTRSVAALFAAAQKAPIWRVPISGRARDGQMGLQKRKTRPPVVKSVQALELWQEILSNHLFINTFRAGVQMQLKDDFILLQKSNTTALSGQHGILLKLSNGNIINV